MVAGTGFDGLLKYSNEKKDKGATIYLLEKKSNGVQVKVHEKWRKLYRSKRKLIILDSEKIEYSSSKLANTFEWKMICSLYGDKCESKKNFRKDWCLAATMEIRQIVEMSCKERMREKTEDQLALEVLGRVNDCSDFVAVEGFYHVNSYARFYSQRDPKRRKAQKLVESLTQRLWKNFKEHATG